MPSARVNGIEMFYREIGDAAAEPLLLVMGWGGDSLSWAFQFPAFAPEYHVIAPDNRGAGQSDAPDAPYTIPGMADDAVALLDRLKIDRAHVAGASMGGMIAQEIALRHPSRVRTLQLHCTLARPDAYNSFLVDVLLKVKARGDREEFTKTMVPWVLSRHTMAERPDFVRVFLERSLDYPHTAGLVGMARQAEAIAQHDTLDRLTSIVAPTLITVGADDILVPPAFSRAIHARMRGSELLEIPDAGHLHFMERPEPFNAACLEFLHRHRAQ
jgi:pimeloyl-ACP methyl ester carboxylesterase